MPRSGIAPMRRAGRQADCGERGSVQYGLTPYCTLLVGKDHVAHDGVDLGLPALAAEYAVVADPRLQVVALHIGLEPPAQVVRRRGLADAADVVALALHGE